MKRERTTNSRRLCVYIDVGGCGQFPAEPPEILAQSFVAAAAANPLIRGWKQVHEIGSCRRRSSAIGGSSGSFFSDETNFCRYLKFFYSFVYILRLTGCSKSSEK